MDFINKDDKEIIRFMNESLGTQYRTTLYDFNNPDDVIEAVKMATAEYCDLAYYWGTCNKRYNIEEINSALDNLFEVFSSIEYDGVIETSAERFAIALKNDLESIS